MLRADAALKMIRTSDERLIIHVSFHDGKSTLNVLHVGLTGN